MPRWEPGDEEATLAPQHNKGCASAMVCLHYRKFSTHNWMPAVHCPLSYMDKS